MTNTQLAHAFYYAFAEKDVEKMVSLYHPEAQFKDPAFGELKGEEVKKMWRSIVKPNGDLRVSHKNVREKNGVVTLNWEANYTFSPTGNKVLNKIKTELIIENGQIIRHMDSFSLWKWSRQALGVQGLLLGFTPMFKRKFQEKARKTIGLPIVHS